MTDLTGDVALALACHPYFTDEETGAQSQQRGARTPGVHVLSCAKGGGLDRAVRCKGFQLRTHWGFERAHLCKVRVGCVVSTFWEALGAMATCGDHPLPCRLRASDGGSNRNVVGVEGREEITLSPLTRM